MRPALAGEQEGTAVAGAGRVFCVPGKEARPWVLPGEVPVLLVPSALSSAWQSGPRRLHF